MPPFGEPGVRATSPADGATKCPAHTGYRSADEIAADLLHDPEPYWTS